MWSKNAIAAAAILTGSFCLTVQPQNMESSYSTGFHSKKNPDYLFPELIQPQNGNIQQYRCGKEIISPDRIPNNPPSPCLGNSYQVVNLPKSGPTYELQSHSNWEDAEANYGSSKQSIKDPISQTNQGECVDLKELNWPLVQSCKDINHLKALGVFALQLDEKFSNCQFFNDKGCKVQDDADDDIGPCPHMLFRRGVLRLTGEKINPVICCRVICPVKYRNQPIDIYQNSQFKLISQETISQNKDIFYPKIFPSRAADNIYTNSQTPNPANQLSAVKSIDEVLTCVDPKTSSNGQVETCQDFGNHSVLVPAYLSGCNFVHDTTCSIGTAGNQNSADIDTCLVSSNQLCPGVSILALASQSPQDIRQLCQEIGILKNLDLNDFPIPQLLCCRAICTFQNQQTVQLGIDRDIWTPTPTPTQFIASKLHKNSHLNITVPPVKLQKPITVNSLDIHTQTKPTYSSGVGAGGGIRV